MRVAFYVRVSTPQQTQTQTIEQQLERLHLQAQQQGWVWQTENIFRDDGFSGASLNRPGLDQLRDKVANAYFDKVVITAPDRLARKYIHQMLILEEFEKHNCEVEFLDHPMTKDPNDQLLLQIRGAVSEYERTLISERLRRGRQYKYRAGTLLPWTSPPYGYRSNPDLPRDPKGVAIDPVASNIVAEVFSLYLEPKASLASVGKTLTKLGLPTATGKVRWSLASVRRILTNPVYCGEVYAGKGRARPIGKARSPLGKVGLRNRGLSPIPQAEWILVGHIPPVVTKTQFEQVQAKIATNGCLSSRNNKKHQYLLRTKVSCGFCRQACIGQTRKKYAYYACRGKSNAVISCRDEKCTARTIAASKLDALVWADLCDLITHPASIKLALERACGGQWLPQELQARRENLGKSSQSLANQIERLTQAYLEKILSLEEYKRRREDLDKRREALEIQMRQLEISVTHQLEVIGLAKHTEDLCQRIQSGLEQANFEQKRQLIELIIERVVVSNEEVEIRYVIPTTPSGETTKFYHLRLAYSGALS